VSAVGYFLGQLIGLAMIPAAIIWWLRGTRPGRLVAHEVGKLVRRPAQRRALAEATARHHRYAAWCQTVRWWTVERDTAPAGSHHREAAHDMVRYFQLNPPHPCYCQTCLYLAPPAPRSHR
jgi:hypothetical protein